jgi:hypothetical protein
MFATKENKALLDFVQLTMNTYVNITLKQVLKVKKDRRSLAHKFCRDTSKVLSKHSKTTITESYLTTYLFIEMESAIQ